jgi:hypothetical protein
VGSVLGPPVGVRKRNAFGRAGGTMCPIVNVVHKLTRLGEPNTIMFSPFQVSEDMFHRFEVSLGGIVGELGK